MAEWEKDQKIRIDRGVAGYQPDPKMMRALQWWQEIPNTGGMFAPHLDPGQARFPINPLTEQQAAALPYHGLFNPGAGGSNTEAGKMAPYVEGEPGYRITNPYSPQYQAPARPGTRLLSPEQMERAVLPDPDQIRNRNYIILMNRLWKGANTPDQFTARQQFMDKKLTELFKDWRTTLASPDFQP